MGLTLLNEQFSLVLMFKLDTFDFSNVLVQLVQPTLLRIGVCNLYKSLILSWYTIVKYLNIYISRIDCLFCFIMLVVTFFQNSKLVLYLRNHYFTLEYFLWTLEILHIFLFRYLESKRENNTGKTALLHIFLFRYLESKRENNTGKTA